MTAVCNGIGSLFLSSQKAIELSSSSTKERRAHQKRHSRGSRDGKTQSVIVSEKWKLEWLPQRTTAKMVNDPTFFKEALQRSIATELIGNNNVSPFEFPRITLPSSLLKWMLKQSHSCPNNNRLGTTRRSRQ